MVSFLEATAKATLSFLPGSLPGPLGMEPLGKWVVHRVKEISPKKAPSGLCSKQTLGSQCLRKAQLHPGERLSPGTVVSDLPRWPQISSPAADAFKRAPGAHWLNKAPPPSLPAQVRAARLRAVQEPR